MDADAREWVWDRLGEQHRAEDPHLPLGEAAVARGWIGRSQLQEALDEQERLRAQGEAVLLGQLFLRRNLLTADQLAELLRQAAVTGRKLGRYELRGELGRGGMGAVFRAWDPVMKRLVAIKKLHWLQDPERMKREALASARLQHPNIVTTFELGNDAASPYLVMELVEGAPLIQAWADWSWQQRVRAIETIARAVDYAHERGVVHRDLKPGNVMVTASGDVKVLDLGLAALEGEVKLTRTGEIMGTPVYMAPEQAAGRPATRATDVYALGVMLYEALAGTTPFQGENAEQLYALILQDDPMPLRRRNRLIPADLDVVCLKALEKAPERRFRSAAEFADELSRWLSGETILTSPPSPLGRLLRKMRRHKLVSALSAILILAALSWGGSLLRNRIREAQALERGTEEGFLEALRINPDNREADRRLRALRAARFVVDGDRAAAAFRSLRSSSGESAADFAAETRIRKAREQAERLFVEAVSRYLSALSFEPDHRDARSRLAALFFERFVEAEAERNAIRAIEFRELVLRYDDGSFGPRLNGVGRLRLRCDPRAEIELRAVAEGEDGRWIPGPGRNLGGTPVDLTLARGSYLLILRAEGMREVRLPLWIERDGTSERSVRLIRLAELGGEFVQIPAGRFPAGGDARAPGSVPSQTVDLPEFFISRHEVRVREYAEFLREAPGHAPRDGPLKGGRAFPPEAADLPVTHVSWFDAMAYCDWLARRHPDFEVRLPTAAEWEKAARGEDARPFVWGDGFAPDWCKGGLSTRKGLEPVGAYPQDESPYGVRDLAGSVSEWCFDRAGSQAEDRIVRGGAWSYEESMYFRAAYVDDLHPEKTDAAGGFRVVMLRKKR